MIKEDRDEIRKAEAVIRIGKERDDYREALMEIRSLSWNNGVNTEQSDIYRVADQILGKYIK